MGAFAPTPKQKPPGQETQDPFAQQSGGVPPSTADDVSAGAEGSFAPQQGFDGGQVAGTPPSDPTGGIVEQNEGMFSTFQEIEAGLRGTQEFLMTLTTQFPGAAESVRRMLEPLQAAEGELMAVIQAVSVEAAMPTPSAPRSAF